MSKNVAVFVDVANIFYAAKAAGVDIDYVTLLKSATSGRDFVRAYAYTGLDPENENQRQFHAFLARSGYKVVSKDIRKYGDGRIKANLDIELVVDMMRMAEHLDIAVVVSGDGDFAPAIRAVQQKGVRVEVISFRGNTSSDLIEVADVFTDIAQIARVEKGVRSGRRVAGDGDLSMTEVPEKETEGPVRRRRGGARRTVERDVAATAVASGAAVGVPVEVAAETLPGNVIVLPGERLSRVDTGEEEEAEAVDTDVSQPAARGGDAEDLADGDARRRRRRRGGRGRGRGRLPEGEQVPVVESLAEEDDFLDETPVALPQHSTFGSVWDSQLGVPTAPHPASTELLDDEEEYEDEPEIPEYLLAERRRQAGRQRGRGRERSGGGYRSALDRERYGKSGVSSFGGGGGMRAPDRPPRQQVRPQAPQPPRSRPPFRERPSQPAAPPQRAATSAEPWSEVPPEVAELLKAELARRVSRQDAPESKEGPARGRRPRAARNGEAEAVATVEQPTEQAPIEAPASVDAPADVAAKPKRATRSRKAAAPAEPEGTESLASPPAEEKPAPKRRAPRRTAAATGGAATATESSGEGGETPAAPAKPRRRTTTRKASAASGGEPASPDEPVGNG